MDLLGREAPAVGVADREDAVGVRHAQELAQLLVLRRPPERQPPAVLLQRPDGLLEGFLERPADRHHFTDRFHLRRQRPVGLGELLEVPAGELHDTVVDRRLERGRRLARDVVPDLVERVADGELRRDLGDGEAGRLRGQRGGARHARVHLDDDEPPVVRVHRELDVRAARLDADLSNNCDRGVAHQLIFLIGQRLRRGHGD